MNVEIRFEIHALKAKKRTNPGYSAWVERKLYTSSPLKSVEVVRRWMVEAAWYGTPLTTYLKNDRKANFSSQLQP